jgi:hypothetical protein
MTFSALLDRCWMTASKEVIVITYLVLAVSCIRISSCLAVSGERDLKSCVASVTDAMWLPKCLSQIYSIIAPKDILVQTVIT